jgi:hypothetical protein
MAVGSGLTDEEIQAVSPAGLAAEQLNELLLAGLPPRHGR